MLPLWARVNLRAKAMKGYSAFPKAPALQDLHHQTVSVIDRTLIGRVLPPGRDAVCIFYSPSPQGHGVVANMLDCDIVAIKFKFQSCYYVHLQTNTLGKGVYPLASPSYELKGTTTVLKGWF